MTHRFPVRVYYEDTDLGQVVYYANYLKFIERGRSEWLRAGGIDQLALMQRDGIAFVARRVNADYLSPALQARLEAVMAGERGDAWRTQSFVGLGFDLLSDAKLLLTDELIALMLKERKEAGTLPPGAEAGAGIGDGRGAGADADADDTDGFDEIVTYTGDPDDADADDDTDKE